MASTHGTWSRVPSPGLRNKLHDAADSFIQQFNAEEYRMREIVKELRKISMKADGMQGAAGKFKLALALGAGLAIVLAVLAAPSTKGLSLVAVGVVALVTVVVSGPAVGRATTAAAGLVAAAAGIVAALGGGLTTSAGIVAMCSGLVAAVGGTAAVAAVDGPAVAAAGGIVAALGGTVAGLGGCLAAVGSDIAAGGGPVAAAAIAAVGGTAAVASVCGAVAALGGVLAVLGGGVVVGAVAAADGGVRGVVGGFVVVGSTITKMWSESAKEVEKLGKEFMGIVEPLKKTLEEIAAEAQCGNTLTNQVNRLKDVVFVSLPQVKESLLTLAVSVLTLTATVEEDRKLRDAIIQSADHSQKIIDEFEKTQTHLKKLF